MKKIISAFLAIVAVNITMAQTLKVTTGNVAYLYDATEVGEALVSTDGNGVTIQGKLFNVETINHIKVCDESIDKNTVTVLYDAATAHVTVAGNIAQYVDIAVDGANVSITQSADVSEKTVGEITYALSGTSASGSLALTGSYKSTIELRGLSLTSTTGAALDIQNGKRIALSAKNGTVNTLVDAAGGSQKGAIVCKGHLELKGKGQLDVTGNTSHAIYAKEYVSVKNLTLNILGAKKDGINCTQYFLMESGIVNISGVEGDGVQTDYKDATEREAEDTGTITIEGGTLEATITAVASKGLKAEGDVVISGGDIKLKVTGSGEWDSTKLKTKASSCISADGNVTITGGNLDLTATAGGGKGISCDGTFTMEDGTVKVLTSGGILAYVNNKLNDNYTGNTDNLNSDYKSSPKGIKADTEALINGGSIDITTTGNGGEGIESKGTLRVKDGTIKICSTDDCINSSSHMYIDGGDITVISNNNDGLDSNGDLYINGGYLRVFGARSPECGLDANEEQGYSVYFTGGTVLAVGGSNSYPKKSGSTQPYVNGSGSVAKGTQISLKSGTTVLATFTVPDEYTQGSTSGSGGPGGNRPGGGGNQGSGSILISCPGLTSGASYTLTNNTSTSTVTARLTGSSSRP